MVLASEENSEYRQRHLHPGIKPEDLCVLQGCSSPESFFYSQNARGPVPGPVSNQETYAGCR